MSSIDNPAIRLIKKKRCKMKISQAIQSLFLPKAFFNYIKNSIDPDIQNPCNPPILRKIFKTRKPPPWPIFEKELTG